MTTTTNNGGGVKTLNMVDSMVKRLEPIDTLTEEPTLHMIPVVVSGEVIEGATRLVGAVQMVEEAMVAVTADMEEMMVTLVRGMEVAIVIVIESASAVSTSKAMLALHSTHNMVSTHHKAGCRKRVCLHVLFPKSWAVCLLS